MPQSWASVVKEGRVQDSDQNAPVDIAVVEPESKSNKTECSLVNSLAADVASMVLRELKAKDGPCRFLLQIYWKRDILFNEGIDEDVRYLQAFRDYGKLRFSVQKNAVSYCEAQKVQYLFPDPASAAREFLLREPHTAGFKPVVYLMDSKNMQFKTLFENFSVDRMEDYVKIIENEHITNPVPFRENSFWRRSFLIPTTSSSHERNMPRTTIFTAWNVEPSVPENSQEIISHEVVS